MLDGIVFSGGIDIDPAALRRRPASGDRSGAGPPRRRRAAAARGGARARPADARDLPRLPAAERPARRRPRSSTCRRRSGTRATARRSVSSRSTRSTCEEGTRLETILGPRHEAVRSSHHQGVGRVGAGLVESAYAEDGSLEAIEDPVQAVRARACSGTPRWRRTTSGCSRRSSAEARAYRDRPLRQAARRLLDRGTNPRVQLEVQARCAGRRAGARTSAKVSGTPRSEDCPPAKGHTVRARASPEHAAHRRGPSTFLLENAHRHA